MDYAIYFLFDCLDTLAITFTMLAVFQYPIREYLKEVILMCGILGISSLVAREILGVAPVIDLLIHIFLLTVGLRIFVRVRLYRSILIVAVGAIIFTAAQFAMATIYQSIGVLDNESLNISADWGTRILQLSSQAVSFTAAYIVVTFDLGITKWVRPPHDFYIGASLSTDRKSVLITSSISITALMFSAFIFFHNDILAAAALASALLIAVIMYTYRSDEKNERRNHANIEAYRNNDS